MRENKKILYAVVIILGSAALGLGIVAETTKIKVSDIKATRFGCNYPSTSSNMLGYIAAGLILINQIIISVAVARYISWRQRDACNLTGFAATINFIISCLSAIAGVILLVTALNLKTRHEFLDGTIVCYTVKPGMLSTSGSLASIAFICGLCAYNASTKRCSQPIAYTNNGSALG